MSIIRDIYLREALKKESIGQRIRCASGRAVTGRTTNALRARSRLHKGNTRVRYSTIGLLLDALLFDRKRICAWQSVDGIYCEIDGDSFYSNGTSVQDEVLTDAGRCIWADFFWELTFGNNPEMKEQFARCLEVWQDEGSVPAPDVALLCDSYYCGAAERKHSINEKDSLKLAPLQAAIISGQMVRLEILEKVPEMAEPKLPRMPRLFVPDQADEIRPDDSRETAFDRRLIEKCRKGEYRIPWFWDAEQTEYIQSPEFLDSYVPNRIFARILEKIRFRTARVLGRIAAREKAGLPEDRVTELGGDNVNIALSGKPGTGKTRLAYALSAALGMPIYTVNCSHDTDEDEFEGKTKLVRSRPTAVPTEAVKCFEHGGICLLEEINLPQAAVVMGALGQAVEFPFILKKDGYQTIRRHPLCIFIYTLNTGTAGSKTVSQPFANRFRQSYELDDPTREDFIRILMTTGAEERVCAWVYDAYETIVESLKQEHAAADVESILLSLSMRSCIGAIENIQEGSSPKDAIEYSIIGKIAEQDREAADGCRRLLDSAVPGLY